MVVVGGGEGTHITRADEERTRGQPSSGPAPTLRSKAASVARTAGLSSGGRPPVSTRKAS